MGRSGDTLYSLARRYGTTVDALTRANPGIDPNSLRVGQLICIPVAAAPPGPPGAACPAGSTPYVIRSGDTFYAIARRFNTTVAVLTAANPRVDPNNLRVGQLICIPTAAAPPTAACPAGSAPYTIRSGDTFYRIAQRAGSLSALTAASGVGPTGSAWAGDMRSCGAMNVFVHDDLVRPAGAAALQAGCGLFLTRQALADNSERRPSSSRHPGVTSTPRSFWRR